MLKLDKNGVNLILLALNKRRTLSSGGKTMKKTLSFLSCLMITLPTLVGCGNGNSSDTTTNETPKSEQVEEGSTTDVVEITLLQNKPEIDAKLKTFVSDYEKQTGVKIKVKSCGGDTCQLTTQLKADFASGDEPDIFVIDGLTMYEDYSEYILSLDGEPWVADTGVAFTNEGTVYGFPISIEGWGLAYNKDLLDKAGIDPSTLTSYDAYVEAFKKLDGMKDELGIDSVVSIAAGAGMEWVMRDHNINSYLSNGLEYGDLSITEKAVVGELDVTRFTEYANWVNLLFDYADQTILTTGNYDDQIGSFANQKSVFVHQGNWIEPNLEQLGATFNRGYAPQGSSVSVTDGIFVGAPSWYVVNKNSDNVQACKDFLTYLGTTEEGHSFVIDELGAVPAFNSVSNKPDAPLSASIMEWSEQGKIYSWNQYYLPNEFREKLGPIYGLLAQDQITVDEFVQMMTDEFATLK